MAAAGHPWKPSTVVGYRWAARGHDRDRRLADTRVVSLTPVQLRTMFARWSADGVTRSVIGGRFRVLPAAIGWAFEQ